MSPDQHIKWFRNSAPYINAHRHKTFVLYLDGDAVSSPNFANITADVALLNSLGVRLVLVHGASRQIDARLKVAGKDWQEKDGKRITTPELLPFITETIGAIRADIEARLSMGLVNSPMHGADLVVSSGNFVKARPLGITDGIDFHNTGVTRKVNVRAINQQLENGAIVLISPIGYSLSGETFNLVSQNLAADVATALRAEKLIYFIADDGVRDANGELINEIQTDDSAQDIAASQTELVSQAAKACRQGVNRCHVVSFINDGALLQELFTRDGSGTQVTRQSYERIRQARVDDVVGILELIEPLEVEGVLVKRSRELIESEVERFTVIERDGLIVSCCALYPYGNKAELACLVTHPDYRDGDRGELLLASVERQALGLNLSSLFVLTTHSAHWFTERGFIEQDPMELPEDRRALYNYQRKSKVFEKVL